MDGRVSSRQVYTLVFVFSVMVIVHSRGLLYTQDLILFLLLVFGKSVVLDGCSVIGSVQHNGCSKITSSWVLQ